MYEGYKFMKIEQIVLYAVAENRKPITQEEVCKALPEIERNNIDSTLRKLEKQKLIKKERGKKEKNMISLNTGKMAMNKTIDLLREHWESNWEADWRNAAKG